RRHDEDVGQGLLNKWVVTVSNGSSALGIDVDQDINALAQVGQQRLTQCSVIMTVNPGMLEEFIGFDASQKFPFRNNVIILVGHFTRSRLARCVGNRINEIWCLPESGAQGGLPGTGRSRDDKEDS